MAKVLYMGTPQFAVPALHALLRDHAVVAVVTQPDAPAGRNRTLAASPVKEAAVSAGVPVLQPETLKPPDVVAQLRAFAPDVIVVAAFGQILRADVLALPPRGCVNIHASLLPRWRGASPVSAAIAAGDADTGVTLMLMDAGMDTGPLLSRQAEPIQPGDTTASLTGRLALAGARLLSQTLPAWLDGRITPEPQDSTQATRCRQLKKENGRIDWAWDAAPIERHIRAMVPWPVAWTVWDGRLLRVLRARLPDAGQAGGLPLPPGAAPGDVFGDTKGVYVRCGAGAGSALELLDVQLEGKRAMPALEFSRGQRGWVGARLA